MASGRVTLRGRFSPGTKVRLVRVAGPEALRAEGGEDVATATVDKHGEVSFTTGVDVGARYFVAGTNDGVPLEVRVRGRAADDPAEVLEQPPIRPDRVRLSDGSWADEAPERVKPPSREVGPAPGQHQVPKGTVQRSDTLRGTAHPHDPKEQTPYPRQEDVPKGTVQMSDTETGRATPIVATVQRQEDANGILQRSDTPTGQATPIPSGNAIDAQQARESSAAKAARGEPARAAAEPLDAPRSTRGKSGPAAGLVLPGARSDRHVVTGHDAMGQPLYADAAASIGIEPAAKPVEATRGEPKPAKAASPDVSEPVTAGPSKTEHASTGAGAKAEVARKVARQRRQKK